MLADVPLLAGADEVSLAALAAEAEPLRVLAGDWALREGDEARELYVVLRGRLRAVAADGRTLRVLGPGAAIGELALLTGAPRSASVQAIRDSTLLRLPRERFDELIERDAHFAATVARELATLLQASGGLSAPPTARRSSRSAGSAATCPSRASHGRSRTRSSGTARSRSSAPTPRGPAPSSAPRTRPRTSCSSTSSAPARGATSAPGRPTGCSSSRPPTRRSPAHRPLRPTSSCSGRPAAAS